MLKRILVGLGATPFTTVAIKRAKELAQAQFRIAQPAGVSEFHRSFSLILPGKLYAKAFQ